MKYRSEIKVWTTSFYDRFAGWYDAFMRLAFPPGEKGRERVVAELAEGSVLDVACGTGTLLAMAREKGLACYGVDLSRGMLDQARAKVPEAEFRQGSYYEIPYPDDVFDYVVETNAMSGVGIDAKKVLSEMIRVCKVGGKVLIADWPTPEKETFGERLFMKIASWNDDFPQDYRRIFGELGCEPEEEALGHRYYLFQITKQ
ncbi:MAG: class I SAM-dependent methyltransferase [Anaerolineae bacterium]|jgi:ubiquinone/menaquinone biosynthesis C-methylase UbiE